MSLSAGFKRTNRKTSQRNSLQAPVSPPIRLSLLSISFHHCAENKRIFRDLSEQYCVRLRPCLPRRVSSKNELPAEVSIQRACPDTVRKIMGYSISYECPIGQVIETLLLTTSAHPSGVKPFYDLSCFPDSFPRRLQVAKTLFFIPVLAMLS